MSKLLLSTALTAAAFTAVMPVPSAHAAVIDHDKVVGFSEVTPTNDSQKAAKTFQPFLKVYNGSVPFPAVDAQGNTSGGLQPTGASEGQSSKSTGQIYARSGWYNGVWAIMYAWYFPKDESSPGLGHRHDWETAVIWIDNPAVASPKVQSISYSQHGDLLNAAPTSSNMSGNHALIGYRSVWPLNHSLFSVTDVGGTQPLINWEQLTPAARTALNTTDFGSANVPLNDTNFNTNLQKAWFK
ncbi:NPP1 family protein [Paenibacillus sp. WLX2291]|uniref:NPP1 family protein n=1 Tax=Paenibacillus sp. WLX2291 TaxID=3296934 RepID=UPI003984351C